MGLYRMPGGCWRGKRREHVFWGLGYPGLPGLHGPERPFRLSRTLQCGEELRLCTSEAAGPDLRTLPCGRWAPTVHVWFCPSWDPSIATPKRAAWGGRALARHALGIPAFQSRELNK